MAAWVGCGEAVGGLVADFVAMAASAAWEGDVLQVVFSADAGPAVRMLTAPQTVAKLDAALSEIAGRPVRQRITTAPKAAPPAGAGAGAGQTVKRDAAGGEGPARETERETEGGDADARPAAAPAMPARSQATLVRETMEHPLVAHARGLLDAAIRKVEPGRPRQAAVAAPAGAATAGTDDGTASATEEGIGAE